MKSAAGTKAALAKKTPIRIAVVESDPLRFVGFRTLFDNEPDFELLAASLPEISTLQNVDLILLGKDPLAGIHNTRSGGSGVN